MYDLAGLLWLGWIWLGLCAQWGGGRLYSCEIRLFIYHTILYGIVRGTWVLRSKGTHWIHRVSYHTCASKNIEENMKKRKEWRTSAKKNPTRDTKAWTPIQGDGYHPFQLQGLQSAECRPDQTRLDHGAHVKPHFLPPPKTLGRMKRGPDGKDYTIL